MASHRRKEELMDGVAQRQSIRRRSQVLGVRRQTYHARKKGHRPEEVDEQIAQLLHQTVGEYVAWGFWMVYHYLRRKGHTWNHKRVYRVWKEERLNLRRKPSRPVIRRKYLDLQAPNEINKGWAMDFVSDWVVGPKDKQVRIINVIDECSRRALWTEAHFNITAKTLITVLNQIIAWRGKPQYIRCDNGPEFISKELKDWADDKKIDIWFTQPGKPSQNGLIERLNGTLRRECLNLQWFKNLDLLNDALQEWWNSYNEIRPHSSIRFLTPTEYETKFKNLYFFSVAS